MRYNKKVFRAKIGKIRVKKQLSLLKQDNVFTPKQLNAVDILFDQWVKEPRPNAVLKANTIGK